MSNSWKWFLGVLGAIVAGVVALFAMMFVRKSAQTTQDVLKEEADEALERARKAAQENIANSLVERNKKWDTVQEHYRRKAHDENSDLGSIMRKHGAGDGNKGGESSGV